MRSKLKSYKAVFLCLFVLIALSSHAISIKSDSSIYKMAQQAYAQGHLSVAQGLINSLTSTSDFKQSPEFWLLSASIHHDYYQIAVGLEQQERYKRRCLWSLEKCEKYDEKHSLKEQCVRLRKNLANISPLVIGLRESDFELDTLKSMVERKQLDLAHEYYDFFFGEKSDYIYNQELLYWSGRLLYEYAYQSLGPEAILLDRSTLSQNPFSQAELYFNRLINLNERYAAEAQSYLDSIEVLQRDWNLICVQNEEQLYLSILNSNDSLSPRDWVSHINGNFSYVQKEFKRNTDFLFYYLGEAYREMLVSDTTKNHDYKTCISAIHAYKEYIERADSCDNCTQRILELESLYQSWQQEDAITRTGLDPVIMSIMYIKKGDLLKAFEYSDLSLNTPNLDRAKMWFFRGYILKELYKAQYKAINLDDDSIRYASIDAMVKSVELDTTLVFNADAIQTVRFLASTVYNDASKMLENQNLERAADLYNYFIHVSKIFNPDIDFGKLDITYHLSEASIRNQILEQKEPYDTNSAKTIDSIYCWVLSVDPTNIAAVHNLRLLRESDGNKRKVFFSDLEKENKLNKAESEKRQTQLLAMAGGLSLTLILAGVAFRAYRQKRKDNDVIAFQKQEVEKAHEELTEKNNEILDSIAYAKRIQTAILPPDRIVKEYLQESFILYKPKDVVAGDFYWMESLKNPLLGGNLGVGDDSVTKAKTHPLTSASGRTSSSQEGGIVFFAAADCTGHGVPGAMVSVICNNGLNRSVREFGLREPGEILDKTRELVIQEFEKSEEEVKDGMDISLCALNTKTRELKWAGANNPLWIVQRSEIKDLSEGDLELHEVKANKQPIGKYDLAEPFTTHTIQLYEGDTIYIFSDGYADQFGGENGKKYKSGKFKRTLLDLAQKPISEQREWLDQEFESWRGSLEQIDDVCVIGVKV